MIQPYEKFIKDTINYTEYIAENLDKSIAYSEYIAEKLDNSIGVKYTKYIADRLNNNSIVSGLTSKINWMSDYAEQHSNKEDLPLMLEDFEIISKPNTKNLEDYFQDYFPTYLLNE